MGDEMTPRPPEEQPVCSGDVIPDLTATEWVAAGLAGVVVTGLLVALIVVLNIYWGG